MCLVLVRLSCYLLENYLCLGPDQTAVHIEDQHDEELHLQKRYDIGWVP